MRTPILFMVFNRPDVTRIVFDEIRKARPEKLFISADGPRPGRPDDIEKCRETRAVVAQIDWPCEVKTLFHDKNLGCQLAPSSAVTWFFDNVEAGIILEDDCLPDPSFFPFCEELLERYKDDERVMQISGSSFQERNPKFTGKESYYFSILPYLWGWASWRRAWKQYDLEMTAWPEAKNGEAIRKTLSDPAVYEYWEHLWDTYYNGRRNSWDRPWAFASMVRGGLSINPKTNLISNLGFGAEATHTTDPDGKLSKWGAVPMIFPLVHPAKVEQNTIADAYAFRHDFGVNDTMRKRVLGYLRRKFPKAYQKIRTAK